jgi:hypothetical protein
MPLKQRSNLSVGGSSPRHMSPSLAFMLRHADVQTIVSPCSSTPTPPTPLPRSPTLPRSTGLTPCSPTRRHANHTCTTAKDGRQTGARAMIPSTPCCKRSCAGSAMELGGGGAAKLDEELGVRMGWMESGTISPKPV